MSLGFVTVTNWHREPKKKLHDQNCCGGGMNRDVQGTALGQKPHANRTRVERTMYQTRNPYLSVESKIPNALHSLNQVIMIVGLMAPAQTPLKRSRGNGRRSIVITFPQNVVKCANTCRAEWAQSVNTNVFLMSPRKSRRRNKTSQNQRP